MVAPPQQQQIMDVWPPAGQIQDMWGNLISAQYARSRIVVLRNIIRQMEANSATREIAMYTDYGEEIEYLERQVSN